MTTLVICECGRLQEYDENLSLNCPHCEATVTLPDNEVQEDEYEV